jgi:hypothetical protein
VADILYIDIVFIFASFVDNDPSVCHILLLLRWAIEVVVCISLFKNTSEYRDSSISHCFIYHIDTDTRMVHRSHRSWMIQRGKYEPVVSKRKRNRKE